MATWQASGWVQVAEKYEITENRCVVERGNPEKVRLYNPWLCPEIVSGLANIRFGDDASVLSFVYQWGLSGSWTDHLDRFGWKEEPVRWLEQHAAAVRVALELINLVHNKDSSGVDKYLAEIWPENFDYNSAPLFHEQKKAIDQALPLGGLKAAGQILAALVNYRINEIYPMYLSSDDGEARRIQTTPILLNVIYAHVGAAWEKKTGYYQCANRRCHKWHASNETPGPKRKYCPPPDGVRESLCSRQERYYHSLEKERNQ